MNKIFGTMLTCTGLFVLTACSDYLNTNSESLNEEADVYNNPALTSMAMNGIYSDLCNENYAQLMTIHHGAGTDVELIDGIGNTYNAANERGAMNYMATQSSYTKLEALWLKQFSTIQDCNRLIDGVLASENFANGNRDLGKYLSEAYTIRAMVYLDLIRVFGDLPMVLHKALSDLSNVNVGKTDRDAILDSLIIDLEWVATHDYLPWAGADATTTKVTMGYAKGLLANIYMTRAGYAIREAGGQAEGQPYSVASKLADGYVKANYSDDVYQTLRPSDAKCTELYTKAKQQLKEIIDKNVHKLNPSIVNHWDMVNKRQIDETNREDMFEIPMGFGNAGEHGYTIGIRMNGMTKDWGFSNSSGKVKTTAMMFYSYGPHDPRRDLTCGLFQYIDFDRSTTSGEGKTTIEQRIGNKPFGIYIGKWDVRKMAEDWKQANKLANAKFGYGIRPIRMRYPQILLWYAECENELNNGPTKEAKDALKAVHARAYKTPITLYHADYDDGNNVIDASSECAAYEASIDAITDKETFLNAICEENKLEFCGEGFRKWDLIRWNKLHQMIWKAKQDYDKMNSAGVFQKKVFYRYADDDAVDPTEKIVDWNSVTWYGKNHTITYTDGVINIVGTDISQSPSDDTFCEDYGYRTPKGVKWPGLGADGKDKNGYSNSITSFGDTYKNLNDEMWTICAGLVGTQGTKANPITQSTKCQDLDVQVKNRYLMPIYTTILDSSNGRLYNSYGY